ncbi:MAG TPA: MscL family protein [Candidatus Saccharimonadales bacterium]|nr:MscL family protein [Candidatus Saccharimonadales bacterium]
MADTPKETPKPQAQTKVTETADGSVKITQPKGHKHHGVTILLEPDELVREQVGGFAKFLREYAVIGLAIGFIVGQQANAVVKQIVASFIEPWIEVLFGQNLASRVAYWHHGNVPVTVPWGAFVYAVIEFVFVVVIMYLAVKLLRLDKLKKKKESQQ